MTAYRATFYTLSDGTDTATVDAPNPQAAIQWLKDNPVLCFAQLKEIHEMTTNPTPQPDKITADELRRAFDQINDRLDGLTETITTIQAGIQHAASAAPITQGGTFAEMEITGITMTYDDKGKPAYKAVGTPYNKFGVRVWDEVLPLLGIDPASLHPGPNAIDARRARVLLKLNDEGKQTPQKVTGKA